MSPQSENEAYADLLCSHLQGMTYRLRQLTPEQWDWTPDVAAPTARILAAHTLHWLICDRLHIAEPDARKHDAIPEAPADPQALCDALAAETDRWGTLIREMTPQQMDAPRAQFNGAPMNVRGFICHTIQNSIYKHGQFSTLFYALGLDGTAPYSAPFPNPVYALMRRCEVVKAERRGENRDTFAAAFAGEDVPEALLATTYSILSKQAFGIPVRATDPLNDLYGLALSDVPPAELIGYLARNSGRTVDGIPENLDSLVTVADLVRVTAAASKAGAP